MFKENFRKKVLTIAFFLSIVSVFFIDTFANILQRVLYHIPNTISVISNNTNPQVAQLSAALTAGQVAFYSFDEGSGTTANDTVGSNAGILNSGASWGSGKINGAAAFNGSSGRVMSSSASFITSLDQPHSFFAWINPNSTSRNQGIVSFGEANDSLVTSSLVITSGGLLAWSNNGGSESGLTPSTLSVPAGQWSFVGIVRNSPTQVTLYVNGQSAVVSDSSSNAIGSDPIIIGASARNGAVESFFGGVIDEVRIYNRAVPSSEVSELYAYDGVSSGGTNSPVVIQQVGPVADTTAPTISNIASSNVTSAGVTIMWSTDEQADTQVEYGLTTAYGNTSSLNSALSTAHTQILTGLAANTLYHYRVKSKDAAGNAVVGVDSTFTTLTLTPTINHGIITVSKTDPVAAFSTIQACVNFAIAGDTCLVSGGNYSEEVNTMRDGASNSPIIVRVPNGETAIVKQWDLNHSYNIVDGFTFSGFTGLVTIPTVRIGVNADYSKVLNNKMDNAGSIVKNGAIGFSIAGSAATRDAANNVVISGNAIKNYANGTIIDIWGMNNIIENNTINNIVDSDFFRFFGTGHIIRNNVFTNSIDGPDGNHIDGFQTFGDNGDYVYNILIENNIFMNVQGQIAQLSKDIGDIRDLTIKNNVFINFSSGGSVGVRSYWYNNLFYNVDQVSAHALIFVRETGSIVKNNMFVGSGSVTSSKDQGWYAAANGATIDADYNYISGGIANSYATKRVTEAHGINGGDPKFQNINLPFGSDGIPFTLDDGFKLAIDSPLCSKGHDNSDIGVYSCKINQILSNGAIVNIPIVIPTISPSVSPLITASPSVTPTVTPSVSPTPTPTPTLLPENIVFTQNLLFGKTNTEVKLLQQLLNILGYTVSSQGSGSRGNESTYFGPATRSALLRFQIAQGITASGTFTTATKDKLITLGRNVTIPKGTTVIPTASPSVLIVTNTKFTRNLNSGSTGSDVKALQVLLNSKGYIVSLKGAGSKGQESSYFGPATRNALIKYQLSNNIKPAVGYFGPITRTKINAMK